MKKKNQNPSPMMMMIKLQVFCLDINIEICVQIMFGARYQKIDLNYNIVVENNME